MVARTIYRLGTRRSDLAQTQSAWVRNRLEAQGLLVETVFIDSSGDQNLSQPLYAFEGAAPGLFTKQLESALLARQIDVAVHSLKDLPTLQPPELVVGAVPQREASADVLIIHPDQYEASAPLGLRRGTKVGTSSLRREALLLAAAANSALRVEALRGNVPTRVQKVRGGQIGAAVLAQAGLNRLALDLSGVMVRELPETVFVPAPGQGALAVELRREAPAELAAAVKRLSHPETETETRVERRILRLLEGGCSLPLGVRCSLSASDKVLKCKAFLGVVVPRSEPRKWQGFHHFDFSHSDEESLVAAVVQHFKGFL